MLNKKNLWYFSIFSVSIVFNFFITKNEIQILISSCVGIFLLCTILFFKDSFTIKQIINVIISVVAIFLLATFSGAFLNTYNSLLYELSVYYLYLLVLYRFVKIKNFARNSILALLLLNISLLLPISFRFGSKYFIPISFSCLITVLCYFMIKKVIKRMWLNVSCFILLSLVLSYIVYPQYIQFITGKQSITKLSTNIILTDSLNKEMNIDTLNKKVIVLDFWNSRCGACYDGFSKYETFYKKYKINPNIIIGVVNVNFAGLDKPNAAFDLIKNYSFDKYKINISMDSMKTIGVDSYPKVMVFDSHKQLRYLGFIHYDKGVNNIDDIIEKISKEQ